MNVNVLRREVLQDAHEHPENYPNLTIRVSGYAVHFNRLTPEQRKEVMARTMHTNGSALAKLKAPEALQNGEQKTAVLDIERLADVELDLEHHAGKFKESLSQHMAVLKSTDAVVGSVHSMETFSTTDGPGIRTVVFLQGCAKACKYCANPETQAVVNLDMHPELAMSDTEVQPRAAFIMLALVTRTCVWSAVHVAWLCMLHVARGGREGAELRGLPTPEQGRPHLLGRRAAPPASLRASRLQARQGKCERAVY
eukprot:6170023-Amphidinium_carterae.1